MFCYVFKRLCLNLTLNYTLFYFLSKIPIVFAATAIDNIIPFLCNKKIPKSFFNTRKFLCFSFQSIHLTQESRRKFYTPSETDFKVQRVFNLLLWLFFNIVIAFLPRKIFPFLRPLSPSLSLLHTLSLSNTLSPYSWVTLYSYKRKFDVVSPSVVYNKWLKSLDTQLNESANQNSIKSPMLLSYRIKNAIKKLGASEINSKIFPPWSKVW